MGSLFELVDFGEKGMARKFVSHKKQGGLEAPRNSLDLPVEVSQRLCTGGNNNILCTYHMTNGWSDKNSYTTELPIKKLINEEIGRRPNKGRNAPSVVARLMGVDTLPLDSKPAARQNKKNNETKISNTFKEDEDVREVPIDRVTLTTNSSRHKKLSSFDGYEYCDQDRWSDSSMKLEKPKPREHPQEEELQKFKKEFEAWQTARFRECSKVVELDIPQSQWLAQQNLTREKMALYAKSTRGIVKEKPTELKAYKMDTDPQERSSLQHQKNRKENYADEQNNSFFLKSINSKTEFKENQKFEKVSAPTKIVILRPGFDDFDTKGASWASSPGISEDRGSMEDFLEEVKERLRREMQGKSSKRSTIARGGGIETPYSEKSPDARQLAQRIAKQVRESVTRDLGVSLPRSESTRSYRSEIQFDGTGSPEFINRDTRRFLTERLRNVLKEETCRDIPRAVHGCSRLGLSSKEKMRTEESSGTRNAGSKFSHWDEMKNKSDMQSSSFRKDNDDDDDDVKLEAELSPRNLIRSLSAPVSGTSFGKLLLEDRHILTGAHIRRKHEAIEKVTLNAKKRRKEKFNLKEKVSSFKYSFMLRGKLFGKKLPSLEESHGSKHNINAPTVTMNLYERHENSTEVPPSPASVCSSVNEEFWRPGDNFSPASTPDVHPLDESDMPRVFREISSNLSELRRQLNQLETGIPGEAVIDDQPLEDEMMEIKDNAEAYIRDLLIASGLYDGSSDKYLSRWDPLGKPISNHVFEEVEESYRQKTKGNEGSVNDQGEKLNHKLLCDLLNEALSSLIGAPLTTSRFMKKATGPLPRPPQGRKLLDRVWEMTRAQIYPAADESYYSLDSIVARDLKSTPWTGLIDEDVNALGKDIESQITGDLIQEIIKDMQPLS
nr:uncharacterized protein LOC109167609 [Ipomoea batatas]